MPTRRIAAKRMLLGRPLPTRALRHTLLPKRLALPVFSSDPLSSVAYATQEMMLVLALAGAGAFVLVQPLSAGIALMLVIVVLSYRQTVRAYPHGGGAYIVARENLGETPGLVAAGALLIDYVLTVAVSTAAGVAAVESAFPALAEHRTLIAVGMVAVVTLANLRGVREAGTLFALPTYLFVATILLLIATGLVRCAIGGCPPAPSAGAGIDPVGALTLLVVLRAFASGATALTGVEAISNGVGAFRYPQSQNAATTLGIMAALAVTMFLGISYLATATGVVPTEGGRTVVAEIALAVFGSGPLFLLVQFVTAAILFLAANTAYADFPRLASILAGDRFLPRQFVSRGDRLVFSNGIVLLALAAIGLLVLFEASVSRLIQLYVLGVFTSFTLSQAGMVRHHRRVREPGWQRSTVLNAVGATTTGIVLLIAVITKFAGGGWMVLVALPLLVLWMRRVHRHYRWVGLQLRAGIAVPEETKPNHVVLLIDRVDEPAARALSYARVIGPASLEAVAMPVPGADVERRWQDLAPGVPLTLIEGGRDPAHRVREAVHERALAHGAETTTTALLSETLSRSWVDLFRRHRLALRIKSQLLSERGVVLTDFTSPEGGPGPYTIEDPREHHVLVLVSGLNQATMRAMAYARGLQGTSIRALTINVDPGSSRRLLEAWDDWSIDMPLELVDSPFRELSQTLRAYIREFSPDGRSTIVTCVLPQFVLPHWYQAPLHNQSALLIRSLLLFERGVVTTSVPTRVFDPDETDTVEAAELL